jgi:hypothetical protein
MHRETEALTDDWGGNDKVGLLTRSRTNHPAKLAHRNDTQLNVVIRRQLLKERTRSVERSSIEHTGLPLGLDSPVNTGIDTRVTNGRNTSGTKAVNRLGRSATRAGVNILSDTLGKPLDAIRKLVHEQISKLSGVASRSRNRARETSDLESIRVHAKLENGGELRIVVIDGNVRTIGSSRTNRRTKAGSPANVLAVSRTNHESLEKRTGTVNLIGKRFIKTHAKGRSHKSLSNS